MGHVTKISVALTPELATLVGGAVESGDYASSSEVIREALREWKQRRARADRPRPGIDSQTQRAARAFLAQIADRYPVAQAILYGSRARGDYRPDSDADLAVILKGPRGDRAAVVADMAGTAFHVMLETGVMVEPLPLWEEEFAHPEAFGNPKLIETVRREGVPL